MKTKIREKRVITLTLVNYLLLAIGVGIVWASTHNWAAVVGAFIAASHFEIVLKDADTDE